MSATVTVTEDVTVRIRNFPVNVFDSATVTENLVPKLTCNIAPVTITGVQLWSKLNSASDVTSPTTGTGGAEVGSPTYVAAKFGNGILSDANSEGCTFPTSNNSINFDKGTIEFWAKMKYAHTDADTHYFWCFDDTYGLRFYRNSYQSKSAFRVEVIHDGGTITALVTAQEHAVDDLIHWAVTWNREGNDIGSSKTVAIYRDNVEIASSTTTWNASASINANLYVGTWKDGTIHSDMVIDNLKTYNVCKTDFSHKETEGTSIGPSENVTTSESVSMTGASHISVNDSITLTDVDAVQLLTLFNLAVNDSVTVTESIARLLTSNISVNDSLTLTELVSTVASLGNIVVNDNLTVTENVVPNLINLISTSDSATITDVVSAVASLADISVYDTVTIIEKLYFEWWIGVDEPTPDWTDLEPVPDDPDDSAWTDLDPDETLWTDL